MPNYTYVNNQGQTQTIDAVNPQQAIQLAPNRAQNAGVYLTPSQQIPNQNGTPVINTNTLQGNGTPLQFPSTPPPTQTPQAFVQGSPSTQPITAVNPSAPGAVATTTNQLSGLEGDRSALIKRYSEALNKLSGKGADQIQLEQQAGLSGMNQELSALNQQIATKKAAYDLQQQAYRSGQILDQVSSGKIQNLEVMKAVEIGGLSALSLAKQGSIDSAKAEIDRTLALKYDPIKQEIENTRAFIDLNYQDMSRVEKRQADAVRIQVDRQEKAADRMFSLQKSAFDKLLEKGGTPEQVNALLNAKTAKDIFKIAALAKSQGSGVPADIAEKIGESKEGQKVNASVDFAKSVTEYRNLFKQYKDAGKLLSVEAQKDLNVLRGDLEQKYSVANGQGAVQTGDRESYSKIISGGVLFPDIVLKNMNTLIGSVAKSTKQNVSFLDRTYGNYASAFFSQDLLDLDAALSGNIANTTGSSFWSLVSAKVKESKTTNVSNIYNPNTGFILPGQTQ